MNAATTAHKCSSHMNEIIEIPVIAPVGTGVDEGFPAVAYCADCDTEVYV